MTAIATGIQRMSQLVTDFPQIEELDINPFIVGPPGGDAYVADRFNSRVQAFTLR